MQPIFSRNEDYNKIAFLNWRIFKQGHILNILNIAEGFLISSIELSKRCLDSNKNNEADILIFPILTNANHGIELYLKGILWTLNQILGNESKIEGKHNIKQIFETVKSRIKDYSGEISLKHFEEKTFELKSYITELFDRIQATPKNDKMDFSRYPFSNKYENHFYVNELSNVEIDLENFVVQFTIIKENLDELSSFLYHQELMNDY